MVVQESGEHAQKGAEASVGQSHGLVCHLKTRQGNSILDEVSSSCTRAISDAPLWEMNGQAQGGNARMFQRLLPRLTLSLRSSQDEEVEQSYEGV